MPKKMFINANEKEESRVAVTDERGLLENLIIETSARGQIKGNIYKATIVNVDPGLEAAFIDYGANRHGFLPLSDVQQRYYNSPKEVPPQKAHEFLKKGTELLVQAEREEVMHKGAVFTTFLSLPGRFMVIMPESSGGGISRKIEDENDRKSLKETIKILKSDEDNVAIIIRTAGVGHDDLALKDDYQDLVKEYKNILQLFQKKKGPGLIYEDLDMTMRSLRDYFSKDIDEVFIDSFTVYKKAIEFFRRFMPEHLKCVKHYREKRPLFARFNIEPQIEQMYDRMSPLPSGGTICIDPTEALISIDVNSGGAKSEEGQEMLAFQTNVEAAVEVARQIRLRNLGGLIVIDFIDMNNPKLRRIVERVMQTAVKKDKARIEVTPIGKFGLMEMSRQRIKANFASISKTPCPACDGKGYHRAVPIAASSVLRRISDLAFSAGPEGEVRVEAPSTCASYLLNEKRELLQKIEVENNIHVKININDHIHAGFETFVVSTRKVLEDEEKRESIAKERRERSSSKINTDRFKKTTKISWKFGDGFIEAKELPIATQEILNEHFYEITNQKPPVEEQPVVPEAVENNRNNQNQGQRNNKKFNRRRPDGPQEETFSPLPENFTSFEMGDNSSEAPEVYDTFVDITDAVPVVEQPQTPIAIQETLVQEENIIAAESVAVAEISTEKIETILSNIQPDGSTPHLSTVDVSISDNTQLPEATHSESFDSFEVHEETTQINENKAQTNEPLINKQNDNSNNESPRESFQYLDLNHTARNFGLGLQDNPSNESQDPNHPEHTSGDSTFSSEESTEESSYENDESDFETEGDNQAITPNTDDRQKGFQNQNRHHGHHHNRDNRGNRQFGRKRRRFNNRNNNGGQRPSRNNGF